MRVYASPYGGLHPLTPSSLLANSDSVVIQESANCGDVRLVRQPDIWEPRGGRFKNLANLGPVFRMGFLVQCAKKDNRPQSGAPKRVVLCWAPLQAPGLSGDNVVPGRPGPTNPVWVSCSCAYFRYNCEWALSRYGSSDILYSNGQPARIRNPRGVGKVCKHIYAALPASIQFWSEQAVTDQVVEEPEVESPPPAPQMQPQDEQPSQETEAPEEQEEELPSEDELPPREARFARISENLRSLAFSYDTDCC